MLYGPEMNMLANASQASCECRTTSAPSMRETLRVKRASLESQLTEVNEAIAALDENPGVERVLDLITKTTRY